MHMIKLELLKGSTKAQNIFLGLPSKLGIKALNAEIT